MRDEYDFSNGRKNPYIKKLKKTCHDQFRCDDYRLF